ncbi:MAG: DegT/DnrJ/EryC1/StrS family aminotransferase, partial [Planctomycetota bacterium]
MPRPPVRDVSIPLAQPDITEAEIQAVTDVMRSGVLSIGPKLVEFEEKCAAIAGRQHGIGVNSGTSGLHLCMLAAGIKPGDHVLTTPFSFVASANAALFVNARPVFVDIDPQTLNLDPAKVEAAITEETKAIVAVECFGHPGGMAEVEQIAQRHELQLIEDCCEGFGGHVELPTGGRKIGSFGRAGIFGFYPNKQITTGEGGMIVTDDDAFADRCRSLRNQGRDTFKAAGQMGWLAHARLGYNYRLSEIAAAIGAVQCDRIDEILDARRRVAQRYMGQLMAHPDIVLPTLDDDEHVSWFVFVIRLSDRFGRGERDELMQRLRRRGIGCNNYFPPIHLQPFYRERFGFAEGDFPVCEYVADRTIALPFHGGMSDHDVDY